MKKSFLTKILTIALSAGLIFHPVIVYADEPVQGDDQGLIVEEADKGAESENGSGEDDTLKDAGQDAPKGDHDAAENGDTTANDAAAANSDTTADDTTGKKDTDNRDALQDEITDSMSDSIDDQDLGEDEVEDPDQEDIKGDADDPVTAATTLGATRGNLGSTLPSIENAVFDDSILSWDAVEGAYLYIVYIGDYYKVTEDCQVDITHFFNELVDTYSIEYGTYSVALVALDANYIEITNKLIYQYSFDDKTDDKTDNKTIIKSITVNSNYTSMAFYGNNIQQPSFTVLEDVPVTIQGGWYKLQYDEIWEKVTSGTFTAGTYCYMADVSISDGYIDTYKLDDFVTLAINGLYWTEAATSDDTSKTFSSKDFVIADLTEVTLINELIVTSDIAKIMVLGAELKSPSCTIDNDYIDVTCRYWSKKDGDNWNIIGTGNHTVSEGTYRCLMYVSIKGDNYKTKALDNNIKVIIDGQEWVLDSPGTVYKGYYINGLFTSPEFEVKDTGSSGTDDDDDNNQGDDNQGGNNQGDNNQGGNNQGDDNQGGNNQGGSGSGTGQANQSGGQSGQSQSSGSQNASQTPASSGSSESQGSENDIPEGAVIITTSNGTNTAEIDLAGPAVLGADRSAAMIREVKIHRSLISDSTYKVIVMHNILTAPSQGILRIEIDEMACFDKTMLGLLYSRKDITVEVIFPYQGKKLKVVIPAGYDVKTLWDDKGYCGFLRLAYFLGSEEA